jgi:hypothetical protein
MAAHARLQFTERKAAAPQARSIMHPAQVPRELARYLDPDLQSHLSSALGHHANNGRRKSWLSGGYSQAT